MLVSLCTASGPTSSFMSIDPKSAVPGIYPPPAYSEADPAGVHSLEEGQNSVNEKSGQCSHDHGHWHGHGHMGMGSY